MLTVYGLNDASSHKDVPFGVLMTTHNFKEWPRRNFAKMFDTYKTWIIGLPSAGETRSPAGAGIANRPLVFLGIF